MKTLMYPERFADVLAILGAVLIVIGEFVIEPGDFVFPWLRASGLFIIAFSSTLFGLMAIRFYGFAKKRLIAPGLGLLMFSLAVSGSFFTNNLFTDATAMMDNHMERMLDVMNSSETPLERKSWLSKFYAHEYYIKNKIAIEYFKENGSKELYIPKKSDFQLIEAEEHFFKIAKLLLVYAYLCIAGLVLSLLLAFYIPMQHRVNDE